jgi:glycine hydroxymethyltransferase
MKEEDMKTIALLISKVLKNLKDEKCLLEVKEAVKTLCDKYPLYYERINNTPVK